MKAGLLSLYLERTLLNKQKQWLLCFVFSEACSLVIALLHYSRIPKSQRKNIKTGVDCENLPERGREKESMGGQGGGGKRQKGEKGKKRKKIVIAWISVLDFMLASSLINSFIFFKY